MFYRQITTRWSHHTKPLFSSRERKETTLGWWCACSWSRGWGSTTQFRASSSARVHSKRLPKPSTVSLTNLGFSSAPSYFEIQFRLYVPACLPVLHSALDTYSKKEKFFSFYKVKASGTNGWKTRDSAFFPIVLILCFFVGPGSELKLRRNSGFLGLRCRFAWLVSPPS